MKEDKKQQICKHPTLEIIEHWHKEKGIDGVFAYCGICGKAFNEVAKLHEDRLRVFEQTPFVEWIIKEGKQ